MQILYGVVGEGMGHAVRSSVAVEFLLAAGHEVRVVVSGRAVSYLRRRLGSRPRLRIDEIRGFELSYEHNRLQPGRSLLGALRGAPRSLAHNLAIYSRFVEERFRPELVFTDFETWAALYALERRIPAVALDNLRVLSRCRNDHVLRGDRRTSTLIAQAAVRVKTPGVAHYLVTSFFFPPVTKPRTTLIPPVLRREVLAARREAGRHVLVYQTSGSNDALLPALARVGGSFRVYGMGRVGRVGDVELRPFDEAGFLEDLRTARAVIVNGGFTVLSEAIALRVPILSVPIDRQLEQEVNARYVELLGYGARARQVDADVVASFLEGVDGYQAAVDQRPRLDDAVLFACLDEILRRRASGDTRLRELRTLGVATDPRLAGRAPRG